MNERGILMRPPMVRALVATDKWETRRPLKEQPHPDTWEVTWNSAVHAFRQWKGAGANGWTISGPDLRCPYGYVGDWLYVRESIARCIDGRHDGGGSFYLADREPTILTAWPWKKNVLPSIHMPRSVSRMQMKLTGVRAERLQQIDDVGALREGFCRTPTLAVARFGEELIGPRLDIWETASPRENYLWFIDTIHGAGYAARNEWVWVLQWESVNLTYIQDPGAI